MEFEEVFTSPFTTQTTCYSCGRKRSVGASKKSDSFSLQFATENHILGVRMLEEPKHNCNDGIKTSCRFLPRDSAQLTCVGYANWENEEEEYMDRSSYTSNDLNDRTSNLTIVHHIEAIALIDPGLVEDPELLSPAVNLHRPSSVVIEKDDNASAANSNVEGRQQSKRTSVSTINSGATSTTANPTISTGSYHRKSQSELSKGSQTTISDTQQSYHTNTTSTNAELDKSKNGRATLTQKSKARLVMRQDQHVIHRSPSTLSGEVQDECNHDQDATHGQRQLHKSSFALLDFRPLCPCVARWGERQRTNSNASVYHNDENGDGCFVGVWLGSADDATLRLYTPSTKDPRSLVPVALPEEHFSVDSPIMALDFCSVRWSDYVESDPDGTDSAEPRIPTTMHTLAIGCQDGTIQLITWRDASRGERGTTSSKESSSCLFADIRSQKVIVDGPLVCLKLDHNEFASLRVIVGSLCGYVCQLTYDYNNRGNPFDCFWEGPHMVVQDLFNSSINTEESVLTVDVWDNYVAVGTQLGRCLLYATHDSENYFLAWQVVLPYPVHGIVINLTSDTKTVHATTGIQEERKRSRTLSLAVTTRRSFHLFRGIQGDIKWRQKPKRERYSSDLARIRLTEILEGIRKENQAVDFVTRKCVREIIGDLLEKVETAAKENNDERVNYMSADHEKVTDVISSTIGNLIDRVEERSAFQNRTPASSIDSYVDGLEEKIEVSPHNDPPQWEYSSSDEETSLELERDNTNSTEGAQRLSVGTKGEDDVDEHV